MIDPGTVLVSGAGSGIGRAIVQQLDREGRSRRRDFTFILLGRDIRALEKTRRSLANPKSHRVVSVDLRDARAVSREFEKLRPNLKNLKAVIANAGAGRENNGPDRHWMEMIDTNLTGTYRLIHETLPSLRRSRHEYKHVIVLSSVLARMGTPRHTGYCASKAGLLGLTRALAVELGPEKILVNAISPGTVRGGMSLRIARQVMKDQGVTESSAYGLIGKRAPLGKVCEPEEIGRLVAFLISGDQVSMTGQSFEINNGILMP